MQHYPSYRHPGSCAHGHCNWDCARILRWAVDPLRPQESGSGKKDFSIISIGRSPNFLTNWLQRVGLLHRVRGSCWSSPPCFWALLKCVFRKNQNVCLNGSQRMPSRFHSVFRNHHELGHAPWCSHAFWHRSQDTRPDRRYNCSLDLSICSIVSRTLRPASLSFSFSHEQMVAFR